MFVVCFLLIKMQQFIYIFPNHVILQINLISWFFISKIGIFEDLKLGDSVAVNGVCLTATHISGNTFQADVMNETFNRSSLGSLKKGSVVNLERAMAANGRFGGHMVAGHVDDTGELVSVKQDDNAVWFTIKAPENIMKYCIEKGSIELDGISLTIAKLSDDTISVSMIPHTIKNTNFGY